MPKLYRFCCDLSRKKLEMPSFDVEEYVDSKEHIVITNIDVPAVHRYGTAHNGLD